MKAPEYRADLADYIEDLDDMMADLEDLRDDAQDALDESGDPSIQQDITRMDAALALLAQAAALLESE